MRHLYEAARRDRSTATSPERAAALEAVLSVVSVVGSTTSFQDGLLRLSRITQRELGFPLERVAVSAPRLRRVSGADIPNQEEAAAIDGWRAARARRERLQPVALHRGRTLFPVQNKSSVLGSLEVRQPRRPSPDESLIVEAVASGCAELLSKATLVQSLNHTRKRLAAVRAHDLAWKDIETRAAEALSGIGVELRGWAKEVPDPELRRRLLGLAGFALAANREVSRDALGLALGGREGRPLPSSLRSLARRFSILTGLRVKARLDPDAGLSSAESDALYQVAAEALLDAEWGGRAETVTLSLTAADAITLRIRDDGLGLTRRLDEGPSGLLPMLRGFQQTLDQLGGAIKVRDASPRGLVIEASLGGSLPEGHRPRLKLIRS